MSIISILEWLCNYNYHRKLSDIPRFIFHTSYACEYFSSLITTCGWCYWLSYYCSSIGDSSTTRVWSWSWCSYGRIALTVTQVQSRAPSTTILILCFTCSHSFYTSSFWPTLWHFIHLLMMRLRHTKKLLQDQKQLSGMKQKNGSSLRGFT